ncbi:MAG TPA: acylphosphatase [Tepidisphaeraceae bacterium]|nr:acylphosphatase [Tepidisphaeraceae bacterium]
MDRLTCVFTGRVQGVGFRYTVHNLAMQYNVQGYVRNLPDGGVEVAMEGPENEMTGLLEEIKQKMDGYIRDIKMSRSPATGEFQRFFIRH